MYEAWATDEEWINFRIANHSGHVPSNVSRLVEQKYLPSAGKRRRDAAA
jgi:hypothetical protein